MGIDSDIKLLGLSIDKDWCVSGEQLESIRFSRSTRGIYRFCGLPLFACTSISILTTIWQ
jgi:hypothetical protein